jgi:hypothetical protein
VNGPVDGGDRAERVTIPGTEAAVMLHSGPVGDTDQTYGALGTVVAERAIEVEGPIREYSLVPFTEPDPVPGRRSRWWPLAALMVGTFVFVLDFFIVNVALPSIQHGLGAGESAIQWMVAGYAISTAVLLVTGGRLGNQFGRRRMFAAGLAVFVLTSAARA